MLDVAGGKGELAFELLNLNNITSTVIDPRPTALGKFKTKFEYGIYSRNPALAKWNPAAASHGEAWLPQHLRLFFNSTLFERLECDSDLELAPFLQEAYHVAETTCWTNKGLTHEDGTDLPEEEEEEEEGCACCCCAEPEPTEMNPEPLLAVRQVREPHEVRKVLTECSGVFGMHPDQVTPAPHMTPTKSCCPQAAEPIVDWALRMNKPFAVVPCCVYSKEFPNRYSVYTFDCS